MADRMTQADLEEGRGPAQHLIGEFSKMRPTVAVGALCRALAGMAVLAECGPYSPIVLYRGFYIDLCRAMGGEHLQAYEEDIAMRRQKVAVALQDSGLVSLRAFAGMPLEHRQTILDRIIEAAHG